MPYVKNNSYRDLPFSSETPPRSDFFVYYNVEELAAKCETCKEDLFKCRTIGILESICGKFYLKDLDNKPESPTIQISLKYMKTAIKSTYSPLPVQIVGMMQWKNRPVLFAQLVQDLTPATAIRLKKSMSGVTSIHLATDVKTDVDSESEATII